MIHINEWKIEFQSHEGIYHRINGHADVSLLSGDTYSEYFFNGIYSATLYNHKLKIKHDRN